jgi:5-methylthioadenosine/S-adenosylhomocysteine deaminase
MKEEVDLIIRNVDIITLDEERPVLRGVDLIIDEGWIRAIGPSFEVEGREELNGKGKVAIPGLIDCHTHAFQILLRGSLSLKELNVHPIWLKVLIPFEAEMNREEAEISANLACLNMIRKGITAFADAGGPYPEILGEVARKSGLRARITHSTMDRGPENYYRDVEENRKLVARWREGTVLGWYSIRQIMTSSDELIAKAMEYAKKDGVGVHIHLNEEFSEVEHALNRWGMRPVEYLYRRGLLGDRVLAAHCAFLTDEEVRMLAESGAKVVHCPMINMAYMTFPKVPRMLELGVPVALGSDGGSYRGLDLFTEINIAVASHTAYFGTPYYDFNVLPILTALRMATKNGARAIMDARLGMIKEGYRADMILIDRRKPHLVPMYDLTSIPLFATGNDVSDVIVDGRIIMRDGRVITLDEEAIVRKAEELSSQVLDRIRRYLR